MSFLKYITLFPLLYALIKGGVELVEVTQAGLPGEEKKAAVLNSIKDGWATAQSVFGFAIPVEPILPVIGFLIDLTVSIYNAIGYFKKATVPA